jgi:hypothetical protein
LYCTRIAGQIHFDQGGRGQRTQIQFAGNSMALRPYESDQFFGFSRAKLPLQVVWLFAQILQNDKYVILESEIATETTLGRL